MISFKAFREYPLSVKQYFIITGNYWAFTLTDGALRMLVVLYFYQLGYQPLAIAMLFIFYEAFGVVTNLLGGWLGAKFGLNKTMHAGLILQILALSMLAVPQELLTIFWVMCAQALSGVAKDLNKMSAKSSLKFLTIAEQNDGSGNRQSSRLYYWVSLLTGSKNALKGLGFFLGGFLLTTLGFQSALILMALVLVFVTVTSISFLQQELGKTKFVPKFKQIWSKSRSLNYLSAARLCLFAARDVWFVIALPLYLITSLQWSTNSVGIFLACWIIGYGFIQSLTPHFIRLKEQTKFSGNVLAFWALLLSCITLIIASTLYFNSIILYPLVIGLLIFGGVFAVNSALHSYTIVAMANKDSISLDVGFYYMANAMGRLLGTVLSGWVFQASGLIACLILSAVLALCSALLIRKI